MRRIAVCGPHAERAAAALIRALRADGRPVVAAYADAAATPAVARDFVCADGTLLPNDAFWLEWATGQPLALALPSDLTAATTLVVAAGDRSAVSADGLQLIDTTNLAIFADEFGRPVLSPPHDPAAALCRIGVLGDPGRHPDEYPAVLAQIGDAADRSGIAVKPVLVPAADALADGALDGLHGIVLPGGADIRQVAPQITVADSALARGLPTLGLCLGMQSMATALVRASVWHDSALEEVAGPGPHRSFVRMRADGGSGLHRLGDRRFEPVPGTRLAELLPLGATLRMNHRYRFNPDVAVLLADAVLHRSGEIVDAIEAPAHPFFIGLQGHPEFGCDPALFPLWDAFVHVAAANSRTEPQR